MKKPQLFLLHFAGGNCYSFQFLQPYLRDFEVTCPELPGRGRRMTENLVSGFDEAAEDMYRQISARLSGAPFAVYGHSMGAYLGLRVTGMLEQNGLFPACLVVSGNPGPGVSDNKQRHLMEHDAFMDELHRLGGLPEGFAENAELMEFFEPILRADFEITETNELMDEKPVQAPLVALMGDTEEKVEEISNWGRYTLTEFSHLVLPGDHFFIHKHPQQVAAVIKKTYDNAVLLRN